MIYFISNLTSIQSDFYLNLIFASFIFNCASFFLPTSSIVFQIIWGAIFWICCLPSLMTCLILALAILLVSFEAWSTWELEQLDLSWLDWHCLDRYRQNHICLKIHHVVLSYYTFVFFLRYFSSRFRFLFLILVLILEI